MFLAINFKRSIISKKRKIDKNFTAVVDKFIKRNECKINFDLLIMFVWTI